VAEPIANDLTGESQRPKHAGVWVRVAANLLDVIIMGVPVLLLVTLILQAGQDTQSDTVSLSDFYNIETLANAVLLGVVTVLLWVNWDGRTPGKKLLNIRIVSYPDYGGLSYVTATLRTVLSLTGAVTAGVLYLVIAAMIDIRADRRGFHDIVAGTCVVHDR